LSVVLQDLNRLEEARRYAERAVQLDPRRTTLHVNLGTIYRDLGEPAAAIDCYQRALAIDPDDPQALLSQGMAELTLGNLAAGWAGYEHRVRCHQFDTRRFTQPRWQGERLVGQSLLVHAEQGLGDTLQFVRFMPLVRERAANVIIAVPPAIAPLLRASGMADVRSLGDPLPPFDVHVPLMSLPHVLGITLENLPHDVPYVAVEAERIAKWAAILRPFGGFKAGIVWQGRPDHRRDLQRSIPLAAFATLAQVPGERLFSLQKGAGSEQLLALSARRGTSDYFEIADLAGSFDADGTTLMDAAATMKNLDLVITCDSAPAHLAGALALPVWVALPLGAEWRWMTERDDSPWYPTMRLFRQRRAGDWRELFGRIADALRKEAGGGGR
jgi:tetratricopeptide (TPR) repeat protein